MIDKILQHTINRFRTLFLKKIDKTVHFTGKRYISYGKHTMISQNSWLNVNERGGERIILGDYDFIGRNNFFTSGKLIEFGDFVITSVNCCFIGANHKYDTPLNPYMFEPTESSAIIQVGDNCFIGANVTLMGNVSIGHGCLLGVNTFIRNMTIPPFSVVVGHEKPRIIKRYSFITNSWKKIEDWNNEDEKAILPETEYKKMLFEGVTKKFNGKIPLPLKAIGKSNGNLYS